MNINEIKYGFELLRVHHVDDIGAVMYELKHQKSGATLIYLENDDTNKCFAVGFRTLPEDSTGICHIIEHSLLCGSKKYPTKEPFVNLLKGSMATFLNAMTAYDWTMYPVASQNNQDFNNLVSVYMDAVFAPLSVLEDKAFLQEGWHLEMTDLEATPSYKGVVYNEMKGAMSSVEEQLTQLTLSSLYKGSCYEHNSGGDPEVIPNLTFEYYKNFYHKYYHPSNALMYLYGKMDLEEKLKFFDEEYLSNYENEPKISIEKPKALIDRETEKDYAINETEDEKDNTYMALAFALDTYDNARDLTGFGILNEVLMSNNEAPLKKILMDAKLGQDINCSIDDDNILPSYHIYLHKTNKEEKERFYQTFIDACKKLVTEGIDKKALLAAINFNEFRNKEMDMGRMPKGLFFAFNLMQSFNCDIPYESYLEYTKYFEFFKKELNNGYFEGLLEKYILNSKHYVQVVLNPSKTLAAQKAEAMNKAMEDLKASMTEEERVNAVKVTNDLIEYQSKKDTPEELACLPKLKLSDISTEVNQLASEFSTENDIKFITHNFNTNKIAYLKMYFDLRGLTADELPYAKLITRLLTRLDTEEFNVNDLLSHNKTYLGGFGFDLLLGGTSKDQFDAYFGVQISSLNENVNKMPQILDQVLNHTIYDLDKIKTILTQMKMMYRSVVIEDGMNVAIDEVRSRTSKIGALSNKIGNLNMYHFISGLLDNFGEDVAIKLQSVGKKIFNKYNLTSSVSGDIEGINFMKDVVLNLDLSQEKLTDSLTISECKEGPGALIIPSEVNYNAKAINLKDLGYIPNGKLAIASHIINYDYLWSEVRVKGGAYGCHISMTLSGDVVLGSYRDPNVENTYEVYNAIADYLSNLEMSEEEFESYLIGAVGSYDQPLSNNSFIRNSDINILVGNTVEKRIARKKEMLETTLDDIKGLASLFKRLAQLSPYYTIGNEAKIKEYNHFNNIKSL